MYFSSFLVAGDYCSTLKSSFCLNLNCLMHRIFPRSFIHFLINQTGLIFTSFGTEKICQYRYSFLVSFLIKDPGQYLIVNSMLRPDEKMFVYLRLFALLLFGIWVWLHLIFSFNRNLMFNFELYIRGGHIPSNRYALSLYDTTKTLI